MKRILFITLLSIFVVPTSAEMSQFNSATYTHPKYIVDATLKKVKNPFLRKKLRTMELELQLEVEKQRRIPNVGYKNLQTKTTQQVQCDY